MFNGKLIKKNGKLTYLETKDKLVYEKFELSLKEDQIVDMYLDLINITHSKAQLAKVHACIRELANESGYTFEEMKIAIKLESGLYKDNNGHRECKSFIECSKEELMLAINTCIQIGKDNYNLSL